MNKINLYGNYKTPSNYTTKSNRVIYNCNAGDCGQVCLCSNNLSSFYDVNLSTPLTNSYLYWSGTNSGYINRLLNFAQTTRLILNDTGAVVGGLTSAGVAPTLRANISATTPYIWYFTLTYCHVYYGTINTTLFNSNSVIGSQITALANNPPCSLNINTYVSNSPTTSNISFSSTTGIYTLLTPVQTPFSLLYSLDLTINASFDNGSYFLVQLVGTLAAGGTVILGTQSYYLNNQMRGYNIIFNKTFTTYSGLASVRATIQYLGGTNLTPFSGITLTNYNYLLSATLRQL